MTQTLDKTALVLAFSEWERDFRERPEGFYTEEEQAALDVADLSEARAIHLMALLRSQS